MHLVVQVTYLKSLLNLSLSLIPEASPAANPFPSPFRPESDHFPSPRASSLVQASTMSWLDHYQRLLTGLCISPSSPSALFSE